jgi:hypothetical protein
VVPFYVIEVVPFSLDIHTVVDGKMVSGRAWPGHPAWMREFMALLRQHAPVVDQRQPVDV